MELFQGANIGLEKTPEANKMIADITEAIADRQIERNEALNQWVKANNGKIDGFEQAWDQHIATRPLMALDENGRIIFNENNKRVAPSFTGNAAPRPTPEQARAKLLRRRQQRGQ